MAGRKILVSKRVFTDAGGRMAVHEVKTEAADGSFQWYTVVRTNQFVSLLPYQLQKDGSYKVLILKIDRPAAGVIFEMIEGGIEPGQSAINTAIAECREETGLQIIEAQLSFQGFAIQQSDRGIGSDPAYYGLLDPKKSAVYFAEIPFGETLPQLKGERYILPLWLDLEQARRLIGEDAGSKGYSPVLSNALNELYIRELEAKA